jgi:hypothetical protein
MAPIKPIGWSKSPGTPITLVGTADWADYTITADVLLESPGSVELLGRFKDMDFGNSARVDAYYFSVSDAGAWSIYANRFKDGVHTTLASGHVAALGSGTWHTLSLAFKGTTLTARVDGVTVGGATDSTFTLGPAGLSVGSAANVWLNAQFDNVEITSP